MDAQGPVSLEDEVEIDGEGQEDSKKEDNQKDDSQKEDNSDAIVRVRKDDSGSMENKGDPTEEQEDVVSEASPRDDTDGGTMENTKGTKGEKEDVVSETNPRDEDGNTA